MSDLEGNPYFPRGDWGPPPPPDPEPLDPEPPVAVGAAVPSASPLAEAPGAAPVPAAVPAPRSRTRHRPLDAYLPPSVLLPPSPPTPPSHRPAPPPQLPSSRESDLDRLPRQHAHVQRTMAERVRRLAIPLGIFAASRVALYGVLALALRLPLRGNAVRYLTAWQGALYISVASRGYPSSLVASRTGSELAYFPLYPMLIRSLHRLSGLSYAGSAIAITLICSALAMVVLWLVVERLTDTDGATRAIVAICFFPWAFIFSMAYAEGLLLLLAGVCLLALFDEQWLTAGLAALLAGVTSPFGVVLVIPCLWAAVSAIRRRGTSGQLLAPVLAPLGVLGFFLYLRARTGDVWVAIHAQVRGVTYDGIGLHIKTANAVLTAFVDHPFANLNVAISLAAVVLVVVALFALASWDPPAVIWAYVVPLVVLGLWLDTFATLPRTMLVAFPLVVALARPLRRPVLLTAIGVSAALMATLFLVVGATALLIP